MTADQLRVEVARSTLSRLRILRSFMANLLAGAATGGSLTWPPRDVILVDVDTGKVVRRWQEHGNEAAMLAANLEEDLATMPFDEFTEKWDVPGPR